MDISISHFLRDRIFSPLQDTHAVQHSCSTFASSLSTSCLRVGLLRVSHRFFILNYCYDRVDFISFAYKRTCRSTYISTYRKCERACSTNLSSVQSIPLGLSYQIGINSEIRGRAMIRGSDCGPHSDSENTNNIGGSNLNHLRPRHYFCKAFDGAMGFAMEAETGFGVHIAVSIGFDCELTRPPTPPRFCVRRRSWRTPVALWTSWLRSSWGACRTWGSRRTCGRADASSTSC